MALSPSKRRKNDIRKSQATFTNPAEVKGGVQVLVMKKEEIAEQMRVTRGWPRYYIERAGALNSGMTKYSFLSEREVNESGDKEEQAKNRVALDVEGKKEKLEYAKFLQGCLKSKGPQSIAHRNAVEVENALIKGGDVSFKGQGRKALANMTATEFRLYLGKTLVAMTEKEFKVYLAKLNKELEA